MEFKVNHIGAYSGRPAALIELTVSVDNAEITECLTAFTQDKVDSDFIIALRDLADELEEHNNKLSHEQRKDNRH